VFWFAPEARDGLQGLGSILDRRRLAVLVREKTEVSFNGQADIPVPGNAVPVNRALGKANLAPGGVTDQRRVKFDQYACLGGKHPAVDDQEIAFDVGQQRDASLGQSDNAIQIALAPVGLVQAYSAAAVMPFNFVKTESEKAGNRFRTANYFDGKCRCVLFHVYLVEMTGMRLV
jgi:hypothetical protein